MSNQVFSLDPVAVPRVETPYRRIVTAIPPPGTEAVFAALEAIESRSMHGQLPIIWERAEDFRIHDPFGNCWIDFTSTIFVTNAGHGNAHVRRRLREVIDSPLLHTYTYASDIRSRYLAKLIAVTPASLEKAFLLSSGTEATECALKLMRLYGERRGKRRPGIVSYDGAMHGRTMGAVLLGGNAASRAWIGFEDPNIHRLAFPYPWTAAGLTGAERAERDIARLVAKGIDPARDLCGIMMESYQGWGAILYPPDYVQAMAAFARANDLLLAFDEIQSGFGRTGTLFCYEHYGVEADLVCCGKGMGSGLPLSGVLGRGAVMDLPDVGSMSSTHSANPLVSAAGLATLEFFEEADIIAESARKGRLLHAGLDAIRRRHPDRVAHVLGTGMVAALLLKDPVTGEPDGETATKACIKAMQKGLILVHTGRESIKMGPPLTISDAALQEGIEVLAESLAEAAGAPE